MRKSFEQIKLEMSKKRSVKRWTKKDVERIREAKETGDWSKVQESRLYNKHGGDYCSLLEVLHGEN